MNGDQLNRSALAGVAVGGPHAPQGDGNPVAAGLRLGYVVPEFPGQTHAFFWREFQALAEQGLSPSMISTRPPREGRARHAFAEPAAKQTRYLVPPSFAAGLHLLTHPWRTRRGLRYLSSLSKTGLRGWVRRGGVLLAAAELGRLAQRQKLDHLHIHSCSDAAHLGALCRLLGGPGYSLTLHGDLEVYGQDHTQKFAAAAFVSVVTEPLHRQVVEQVGYDTARTPVIWMGVDTTKFTPALGDRSSGPLRLATIARLNRCKGHIHALAALRTAIDAGAELVYDIAGDGPAEAEIRSTIGRLNLQKHVNLLGSISEDQVLDVLRRCDVFVLPSVGVGEAAPVSVMEAMACGKPIVCSIIGGTADMMASGREGFLIPQGDEAALAEAFGQLSNDAHLREQMGAAARGQAQRLFDYRMQAARLAEWIRWAAGSADLTQMPAVRVVPSTLESRPTFGERVLPGEFSGALPGALPGTLPGGVGA